MLVATKWATTPNFVLRRIVATMLKSQPGMKEEKENNKDLWEIGALNLLIGKGYPTPFQGSSEL